MTNQKIVNRLSRVGIIGNILLSAFKLFAGIAGKSGAMVSDAVHAAVEQQLPNVKHVMIHVNPGAEAPTSS